MALRDEGGILDSMVGAYQELLKSLHEAGVRYAIAGGLAVVLHGVPRMTFDLDLVVDLADENMRRLVDVLVRDGYRPRVPVALAELANRAARDEWTTERNMIAFGLHHPVRDMEEVDVLLTTPVAWGEIAKSTMTLQLGGTPVVVVGRAVLRAMKLASGREKDLIDAELLGNDDDA